MNQARVLLAILAAALFIVPASAYTPERDVPDHWLDAGFKHTVDTSPLLKEVTPDMWDDPLAVWQAVTGAPAEYAPLALQPGGNETNQTITHKHIEGGARGLTAVWEAEFYGVPWTLEHIGELLYVGTDRGIVAMDGRQVLWYEPIGSGVVSLFEMPNGIGFATTWSSVLPSVGVVSEDGELVWQYIQPYQDTWSFSDVRFLDAGTVENDLLAIRGDGTVMRFDGAAGNLIWSTEVASPARDFFDFVHGEVGDVDGDGINEAVVFRSMREPGALPTIPEQNYASAFLIGEDGEQVWEHKVTYGYESGFSFPAALELVQVDTSPGLEVAIMGWAFGLVSDEYVRILGPTGELQSLRSGYVDNRVEYLELSHMDKDGDGIDELVLLTAVTSPTAGMEFQVQRFAPHLEDGLAYLQPEVSGVVDHYGYFLEYGDGAELGFFTYGDIFEVPEIPPKAWEITANSIDGPWEMERYVEAVVLDDGYIVADEEGLHWRQSLVADDDLLVPFYGRPYYAVAGHYDLDPYPELFVPSSDGMTHVVDGITGQIVDSIERPDGMWLWDIADISGDQRSEMMYGQFWFICIGFTCTSELDTAVYGSSESFSDTKLWSKEEWPGRIVETPHPGKAEVITSGDNGMKLRDGTTGELIWQRDDFYASMPFEDMFVRASSTRGVTAISMADGETVWEDEFDRSSPSCAASSDLFYYSTESDEGGDRDVYAYNGEGERSELAWLDGHEGGCSMINVGNDLLLAKYEYEEARVGFSYYETASASFTWHSLNWPEDVNGWTAYVLATDHRVFLAEQDHVYLLQEGEIAAEYILNGPYVGGGELINVDNAGENELLVWTGDGRLTLLSDNPSEVANNLQNVAEEQGKELDEKTQEILDNPNTTEDGKKKSPSAPLVLLGIAMLGLARRRTQ